MKLILYNAAIDKRYEMNSALLWERSIFRRLMPSDQSTLCSGRTFYFEVVSTQSTHLIQTRNWFELFRRRLEADVRPIEALGGSWTPDGSRVAMRQ